MGQTTLYDVYIPPQLRKIDGGQPSILGGSFSSGDETGDIVILWTNDGFTGQNATAYHQYCINYMVANGYSPADFTNNDGVRAYISSLTGGAGGSLTTFFVTLVVTTPACAYLIG